MTKPQPTRRSVLTAALLPFAAPALVAGGCESGAPAIEQARSNKVRIANPAVSTDDRAALSAGNAEFALALYAQTRSAPGNVVFSPVSVTLALAMTHAGARTTTEEEIAQTLRFTLPQERLHPALNELEATLASRGDGKKAADGTPFRLRLVNALWAQAGAPTLPTYLDVLAEQYGAGVNQVDFTGASEQVRIEINDWVQEKTDNRIKDLLPRGSVNALTRYVLTNAVYFNAAWEAPFDATTTKAAPFTRLDGSVTQVDTMLAPLSRFAAAEGDGFKAVSLPYDDERLSMLIVVPDAGTFSEFESRVDAAKLSTIIGGLALKTVALTMPRFEFTTPFTLKDALKTLGMPTAFDVGADFSGIDGTRGLFIADVLHQAFISVGEKGTEASAATAVIAGRDDSAPQIDLTVDADRPFLFLVRDEPTGAVLFMGRVVDPAGR